MWFLWCDQSTIYWHVFSSPLEYRCLSYNFFSLQNGFWVDNRGFLALQIHAPSPKYTKGMCAYVRACMCISSPVSHTSSFYWQINLILEEKVDSLSALCRAVGRVSLGVSYRPGPLTFFQCPLTATLRLCLSLPRYPRPSRTPSIQALEGAGSLNLCSVSLTHKKHMFLTESWNIFLTEHFIT